MNSCENGHLEVAKWLYQIGIDTNSPININVNYEAAFRVSCLNGHLEVAKWLYQIGIDANNPINIHAYDGDEDAFMNSCENGHLEVAKWLYQIGIDTNSPITINVNYEAAFRFSCLNGHLEVAKWLYQIGIDANNPINIHACNYSALQWSCVNRKLDVFYWLLNINNKVIFVRDNDYYCDNKFYENTLKRFPNLIPGCVLQVKKMDKQIECMIYYDKLKNNIIHPCKFDHYYCEECTTNLNMKCPLCTTKFTQLIIYNPK